MEEESWRRNLKERGEHVQGGVRAFRGRGAGKAHRRHSGGIQEAPWRSPGRPKEAPRRLPGLTRGAERVSGLGYTVLGLGYTVLGLGYKVLVPKSREAALQL